MPESQRPTLVLLVVALGTLLTTLAGSTINLALPTLSRELHLSIELSRWIIISYLLALSVSLLIAGRIGDQLGYRWVYLTGFQLFGLTSFLCGFVHSFWMLIGARVLQGISGAMLVAASPALLTTTFPPEQRGRALGFLGTATYIGLTAGPPLGGLIITGLSWRWVFFLNVPVAIIVVFLGRSFLPTEGRSKKSHFDSWGALLFTLSLSVIFRCLTEGPHWGFHFWPTLAAAALGAILLLVFILVEKHQPSPLLDLRLFRSSAFSGATTSAFCNYVALFVGNILLPFYLMEGKGISPAESGMLLSAQPLIMALVSSPAGWLSDLIGTRVLATLGMITLACGMAGLASLGQGTSKILIIVWQGLIGLGTGLFISPNSSALLGAAPRTAQGVASAVLAVVRSIGMMSGISLGTGIFFSSGGRTGKVWYEIDFRALRIAFLVACTVSLLGAVTSFFSREYKKN